MARKLFGSFDLKGGERNVLVSIATALAALASGKNPDGTDYTLPTVAPAATPTPVATGTGDVQGVVAAANLRLLGYSVRESAGTPAAASFNLRHGTLATDPLLGFEKLAASGSTMRWFGPGGIPCPNGLFVDRVTGETEVVLYTAALS